MTDKGKIIAIYSGVAVISVVLIYVFILIGDHRNVKADESEERRNERIVIADRVDALTDYKKELTRDLKGTNQDGEEVSLFDLKGKAVVFAQFYSRCSECTGYNKIIMQELHKELKENPNVHFVTVTLDPDFDTPEKLKVSAKSWGADAKTWWMMNVPKDELTEYCRKQLWYVDFKENEKKTSAADAIKHDMGIAVIDANSVLRTKVNLFDYKANGQEEKYQTKKSQLLEMIDVAIEAGGVQ